MTLILLFLFLRRQRLTKKIQHQAGIDFGINTVIDNNDRPLGAVPLAERAGKVHIHLILITVLLQIFLRDLKRIRDQMQIRKSEAKRS